MLPCEAGGKQTPGGCAAGQILVVLSALSVSSPGPQMQAENHQLSKFNSSLRGCDRALGEANLHCPSPEGIY